MILPREKGIEPVGSLSSRLGQKCETFQAMNVNVSVFQVDVFQGTFFKLKGTFPVFHV